MRDSNLMPVKKSLSAKQLSQRRICVALMLTVLFACGAHAIAKFWIGGDTSDFVHFYRAASRSEEHTSELQSQ